MSLSRKVPNASVSVSNVYSFFSSSSKESVKILNSVVDQKGIPESAVTGPDMYKVGSVYVCRAIMRLDIF